MRRIIFHCDCNNFFASCECLERPELKNVPMAVAGDPEQRLGIVVAKNELAKARGVKTTDTVFEARRKCPGIVFVPPRHGYYKTISDKVNALYLRYTDYVEPASIDESYLDMTDALDGDYERARRLADELRGLVREEIGITISVGVSFCKVFAKMGSDYKKPDATTVITEGTFREILWPLPVSALLFAGRASVNALHKRQINTIGDLARRSTEEMTDLLGKQGLMLWRYARGLDDEPVRLFGDEAPIKSVSRGKTFRRDLISVDDVRAGLMSLVDEVARTLRRQSLKGRVVTVQIRRPDMGVVSRQTSLEGYTCLQHEIYDVAYKLVRENWSIDPQHPIRALTVGVSGLLPSDEVTEQLSFDALLEAKEPPRARQERLEAAVDALRQKHGDGSITLGFQDNRDLGIISGQSYDHT